MNLRAPICLVFVLLVASTASAQTEPAAPGASAGYVFAHPDRIRFDSRSLIIDGQPVFIFSGEMHYFRCPRELWKDRLQKMKDAGLNCVDTYLAWNLHEPEEPAHPEDFSKLRDMDQIGDFIQMARDLDMYVMIRPGPYICAEWDRGGFPGWLMKHRPEESRQGQFLRGNDPKMLAWDRHWIAAAAEVVRPHLITNLPKGSPGVILWQIENEYDYAGISPEVRTHVLRTLTQASLDHGIDVPIFTCVTMNSAFREDPLLRAHVFDTSNFYPGFDMRPVIEGIEARARYQPEAPRGVTELQGGWFSQVGGALSEAQGHNAAQINQLTLACIERGCTSLNYYMFYGGSNLGMGAARSLTQTYDYNAPLREWGGMGDRYRAVQAIGRMLQEHGQRLIQSEPVPLTIRGDHPDVSIFLRRSADGSRYYFVRNARRNEPRSGAVHVRAGDAPEQALSYDLGAFGAQVLYVPAGIEDLADGQWLPEPIEASAPAPEAAPVVPVRIASIAAVEPMAPWRDVDSGQPLDAVGITDQRYVHYQVRFDLSADDLDSPPALFVRSGGGGGPLVARVNGREVVSTRNGYIPLDAAGREGTNRVEILFENLGVPNFGAAIEQRQGITKVSLVPAAQQQAIDAWRMKRIDDPAADLPDLQPGFDDSAWALVSLTDRAAVIPPGDSAVYRATMNVTPDQIEAGVSLSFETIDDHGIIYVNGREVGRSNDWSHPWRFDVTEFLRAGENTIAVLVRNDLGPGGLNRGCDIEPLGRDIDAVQVSPATEVTGQTLSPEQARRFLVNYRLEFQMPDTAAAGATSWALHLEADSNAFVTLNGHLLGRYWAAGPQREIWLPECWLHFGPDATNVITLQARPTTDAPVGQVIRTAEIRSIGAPTAAASTNQ